MGTADRLILAIAFAALALLLAAVGARAEPVKFRTPDGRTGFADRAQGAAGAVILGEPNAGNITRHGAPADVRDAVTGSSRCAWTHPA
jgi:hypothetical protein